MNIDKILKETSKLRKKEVIHHFEKSKARYNATIVAAGTIAIMGLGMGLYHLLKE